jgi:hypothetical protein
MELAKDFEDADELVYRKGYIVTNIERYHLGGMEWAVVKIGNDEPVFGGRRFYSWEDGVSYVASQCDIEIEDRTRDAYA